MEDVNLNRKGIMDYESFLILEKRIDQLSTKIEINVGMDVITTVHSRDRMRFSDRDLKGDNQSDISNGEIKEFVKYFLPEIKEGIAYGEIQDKTQFVIKSIDRELAMAIAVDSDSLNYWKLIIKTIFRESEDNQLKVGQNQIVYNK